MHSIEVYAVDFPLCKAQCQYIDYKRSTIFITKIFNFDFSIFFPAFFLRLGMMCLQWGTNLQKQPRNKSAEVLLFLWWGCFIGESINLPIMESWYPALLSFSSIFEELQHVWTFLGNDWVVGMWNCRTKWSTSSSQDRAVLKKRFLFEGQEWCHGSLLSFEEFSTELFSFSSTLFFTLFLLDLPETDTAPSILISRFNSTSSTSGWSLLLWAECSNILMASLEADVDIPELKTIKPVWSCATN